MINGVTVLASYGSFGGGTIGNLFAQWEAAGIFAYALPFLLIFAIVFAILSYVQVFKDNKAVVAIISLAVALMALQFELVSYFFADIFPRLGVALSIILVLLILGGIFLDWENKGIKWFAFILVAVTVIAVVWGPLRNMGFLSGWGGINILGGNLSNIIAVVVILGLIVWVISGGNSRLKIGDAPVRNPIR
jgi:hypothetical protein